MPKYLIRVTSTETRTREILVTAPHAQAAMLSVTQDLPAAEAMQPTRVATRAEIIRKEKTP